LLVQLGVVDAPRSTTRHTTPAESKALAERYFLEIMSMGKLDVIDEILHPDFTFNIPTQPEPVRGRSGFRQFVLYLRNAFPDIQFSPMLWASETDRAAARWRITGTHRGEFLGAPATGRRVEDYGLDTFILYDGQIRTINVNENDFGLMQQIGIIPA
jgi:steroid delta-isomerase-like uncharacterized protein